MGSQELEIFTIGHSTRTREELVELLKENGVELLLDIRRIPYSRYNPQFNREEMEAMIPGHGIIYEHCTELGGVKPSQAVIDRAKSCSERSRGFAGYMETEPFKRGMARALHLASERRVALMCAESDPSHCHRFWVADALAARGVAVRHIISPGRVEEHPENLFTYGG
ncbi:MAG: DUF488 domain-containing protein [Candidatus Kapaibacterium sp.]